MTHIENITRRAIDLLNSYLRLDGTSLAEIGQVSLEIVVGRYRISAGERYVDFDKSYARVDELRAALRDLLLTNKQCINIVDHINET